MSLNAPAPRKKARIEIIPLIDIMFFLLASFMLVSMSMIRLQAIDTKVPPPSKAPPEKSNDVIAINIDKNGNYYFAREKTPIPVTELTARLQPLIAAQGAENLKVYINSDQDAAYGAVIAALDQVRVMGLEKISFPIKMDNHFDPNSGPKYNAVLQPATP